MLAVFRGDVSKLKLDTVSHELPCHSHIPGLEGGFLEEYFASLYSHSVIVNLGTYGFMAYSADKYILPSPGPIFCMRDGIYCICRGGTKMIEKAKKSGKKGNEVDLLIECYKDLKREGYMNPFEEMKVFCGDYNCILYDTSEGLEGSTRDAFVVNCWDDMPVYFGRDSHGFCIIADEKLFMEKVCGNCFESIPKGYRLLLPVVVEIKIEPTEESSMDDSSIIKGSGGEAVAASSSGGSNSKKGSGEK